MNRATLRAPDISCDHCIQSIDKAVSKLPGVRFVSGDPAAKQVTLEYEPDSVELSVIEEAMEEAGYPADK